jgi:hypothetical protein
MRGSLGFESLSLRRVTTLLASWRVIVVGQSVGQSKLGDGLVERRERISSSAHVRAARR